MSSENELKVGDTVVVDPHGLVGVVSFKGQTKFAKGTWIGVTLQTPDGKNDGSVKGVKYFDCADKYGLFVHPENVARVKSDQVKTLVRSKSGRRVVKTPRGSSDYTVDPVAVLGSLSQDVINAVVDYENSNVLRIMVEEDGANITGVDKFGNSCLHIVAKTGGGRKACLTLSYLLQHGVAPLMHMRNIYGATAVMVAAREKKWMEMEFLVSQGADVISKGPNDSLPSVWECAFYNLDGRAALHRGMESQRRARKEGKIQIPKCRHKYGTLIEALFSTAHAGDMKYVRMLLEERDMNVNSLDSNGNNCLHWVASDHKRLPIIKYLVAMGAKMEAKNKDGETPCMIAARTRAWKVMKYLVSMGASVTDKDNKGQNVFFHSRVCEAARQALKEGLAEKHENRLTDIDGQATLVREALGEAGEEDLDYTFPPPRAPSGGSGRAPGPADYDTYEQELQDAQNAYNRETGMVEEDEPASEMETYKTIEDVQADLKANHAPKGSASPGGTPSPAAAAAAGPPEDPQKTAGTFSGALYGRKKDKRAAKVCMVTVSEESIRLDYKKGGWFNRAARMEEYRWSDQMSLKKTGADELQVVLDPAHDVSLLIKPCHPDSLEEFIWVHIWKSVFEVSVREAKELLREYESFCADTVSSLQAQALRQERCETSLRVATERGESTVDALTQEADKLEREMGDLLSRFGNIRQQGETLRDTFEKMYEALERRFNTEQSRYTECVNKQMTTKANQLKADMDNIKKQMEQVAVDKDRVAQMYEDMKQQELQYSRFGQEEYW